MFAFQIDNWKEGRDKKDREIKSLKEILTSLKGDREWLEFMDNRATTVINSLLILQSHLYEKRPYHDSIQSHAVKLTYGFQFQQRSGAFENLKLIGVDLISNDTIKQKLIALYDFQYPRQLRIIAVTNERENRVPKFLEDRYTYKYTQNKDGQIEAIPILLESAFTDKKLLKITTDRLVDVKGIQDRFNTINTLVKELIKEIEIEIDHRS